MLASTVERCQRFAQVLRASLVGPRPTREGPERMARFQNVSIGLRSLPNQEAADSREASNDGLLRSRDGEIRTRDPLLPKHVQLSTAEHLSTAESHN